jgi:hypothetical protein
VTSTEQGDERTMCSAAEPWASRDMPSRPWLETTTSAAPVRSASSTTSRAGSPTSIVRRAVAPMRSRQDWDNASAAARSDSVVRESTPVEGSNAADSGRNTSSP